MVLQLASCTRDGGLESSEVSHRRPGDGNERWGKGEGLVLRVHDHRRPTSDRRLGNG